MMDATARRLCAESLRAFAISVERGEVDQVFLVMLSDEQPNDATGYVMGGTNRGAARAVALIASRTDGACYPGSVKAAVLATAEKFAGPDDVPAVLH